MIGKTCLNGSSEMVNNLAISLVSVFFNLQLMHFIGPDGVAAYGVVMYVSFVFVAIFIGFSMGTAPLISFQYGAGNKIELRSLLLNCVKCNSVFSVAMVVLAQALAHPIAVLFCGYDQGFLELTEGAFRIFYLGMLFSGFNIFGSAFFTALNNGLVSAVISFVRTLVLQTACVFLLPVLIGIDGIWFSYPFAEALSMAITFSCIMAFSRRYGYGNQAKQPQTNR